MLLNCWSMRKNMKNFYKNFCLLLMLFVLIFTASCNNSADDSISVNLTENVSPVTLKRQQLSDSFVSANQDFSARLFALETRNRRGNFNISPYSLSFALSIVAEGANGNTLSQFENVLMNGMEKKEWNNNMYSLLKKNENYLSQADILLLTKKNADVKETFLESVSGNFNASVYQVDFKKKQTVEEINNWAKEKTAGQIENIVEGFDNSTVMYTADAIYIDIPWSTSHRKADVKEEIFTNLNGEKNKVQMMYTILSADKTNYIHNENAQGFIKYCANGYRFVAVMPNETYNFSDYVYSFDGNKLRDIIASGKTEVLKVGMPQFNIESNVDFRNSLVEIGIKDAYNADKADFSGISDNVILYMGKTVQKTSINVDISGIRAGAASGQEIVTLGIEPVAERKIVLNRPFIYIILDQNNIPVFIGAVTELN